MKHVAEVAFDLPDNVTDQELAEIHSYLVDAIVSHRFNSKKAGPWLMTGVTATFKGIALSVSDAVRSHDSAASRQASFLSQIDDDVSKFFVSLGYQVGWDFNGHKKRWYEIYGNSELLLQIDMGPSVTDIACDLILLAEGKPGVSKSDWSVRGSHENLRKVAMRISESMQVKKR